MVDLASDPIGTPHPSATCCWCGSHLIVFQVLAKRCWLCPIDGQRQVSKGLFVTPLDKPHAKLLGVTPGTQVCLYIPLPSQVLFEESPAKNVLWGGQAGPGKSTGARWWLYKRSLLTPNHEALLTRENWEQLEKTHLRKMAQELPLLGARLVNREARFDNGAFIDCGHMADADAVNRYLSTNYGVIVSDEASQTPVDSEGTTPLAELSTRAREEYRDIQGNLVEPRFMPVTNPGGPSAPWLKDMFIDHQPDLEKFPALRPVFNEAGVQVKGYRAAQWAYIPAKLTDNPYMREDYADTDLAVLSGVRYRQLAEGDWNVFSGQFFSEWHETMEVTDKHTALRALGHKVGDRIPWHVSRMAA